MFNLQNVFMGAGFPVPQHAFEERFSCYSMAVSGRSNTLEEGDKMYVLGFDANYTETNLMTLSVLS